MDSNNKRIAKKQKLVKILDDLVEKALDELYVKDSYLLENEVHERTIVFRFGLYLQALMDKSNEFNEYNLDCEYNRNGEDCKRLPCRPCGAVPDLIIHQRGSNDNNLLVIEFKPYWEPNTQEDIEKLEQFVSLSGEYKYSCAKSIVFSFARDIVNVETIYNKQLREG